MVALYAAYFLFSVLEIVFAGYDSVSVNTNVGMFIGFMKDVVIDDKTVQIDNFLGIPYAEPPVGDLRFRKPVPKEALKEPLVAQKYGPECKQLKLLPLESATSEDCLFLNIYSPSTGKDREKKAVMIWIYGGAFITGSANVYVADRLAATGDVIVVTINYRVSAFGFLNVGDSNAQGNYGLWDQHLAIKWVHDNIDAFGGDTDRITIFGESAGSASVIYQGLYPGNNGLFHRIIAQSGSPTGEWAHTRHSKEEAKELAEAVGCKTENSKEMTDCLRNVPADTIEGAINTKLLRYPFPFVPSDDGEFVKSLPPVTFDLEENVARDHRSALASFNLLIGANFAEGGTYVSPFFGVMDNPAEFLPNRSYFENKLVPLRIKFEYGKDAPSLLNDLVVAEYTNWSNPECPFAIRDQFVAMHGDAAVVAPMHATINIYLNESQNDLFVYHFVAAVRHMIPIPWIKRAIHAEDMMFVFGSRAVFKSWGAGNEDFECWEKELSNKVINMWTNFAKTGNPNEPRDINVTWPPYTSQNHTYLEISEEMNQSSVKERLDEGRVNLWNRLLPKVFKSMSNSGRSMYDGTCEKADRCSP